MSSREEFEAWVATHHIGSSLEGEIWDDPEYPALSGQFIYEEFDVQNSWASWQASRQALEIVLPDDGISDCERDWGARCKDTFDCGYNYASVQHEKAIEAAGVKVKL